MSHNRDLHQRWLSMKFELAHQLLARLAYRLPLPGAVVVCTVVHIRRIRRGAPTTTTTALGAV
jgi:hypothetical protein